VLSVRSLRRRAALVDAGPRVRGPRRLHGGALPGLRVPLPAPTGAGRAPGRLLSGSLSAPPGALAADPLQGQRRARARGPVGARVAAELRAAARGPAGMADAGARRAAAPPAQVGLPAVARAGPLPRRGLWLGRSPGGRARTRLAGGRRGGRRGGRPEGPSLQPACARGRPPPGALRPRRVRLRERLSRARARAGPGDRGRPHAGLAGPGWAAHRRGPERGRLRGPALRPGLVRPRAAPAPLPLHPGDPRARGDAGRRPRGLVLAPGQAALLPLEPGLLAARSRLPGPRAPGRAAGGLRPAEAPARDDPAARAVGPVG
jgi:hypothetical protein